MVHIVHPMNHHKIPWYLVLVFIFLAIGIGVSGYLYYGKQKEHLKAEEQEELLAVANLKAEEIERWRQERLNDASIIFNGSFIASHIKEFLKSQKAPSTVEGIVNWLASLQVIGPYDSILLLDTTGVARLSIPASKNLGSRHDQWLIKEVLEKKKILFSDLYLDETSKKIYLDLLVPLLMPRDQEALLVGILILRTDPYQYLYPLVQSWPVPSNSAETLLVRREGDEIVFLNELRHQKNTALTLRLPVSAERNPAAMAVRGTEGIIEGIDYRGVKVLAAVKPIKDSPWFLIAKKDQEEVYASVREHALFVIVLVGVLILTAGVTVGLFWRQQAVRLYQRLYQSELERQALEKHYRNLTEYANDIIILFDHQLKIIEVNDRAIASYGYTREELVRMDAMNLRPPERRWEIQDQKEKVEEQKGLLFETIHQRKEGTTFPVEVSLRVIEVEGEKFYQSIIRDITERKKAEEERERLIHELQEALSKVKTLSGLVPICASCKKIRDDKGYWNQIEAYISKRSEAEFSHGICPECARKLYPGLYEDENEVDQ